MCSRPGRLQEQMIRRAAGKAGGPASHKPFYEISPERVKAMKKFKMPTAYAILSGLIVAVAIATWIVPTGQYDYVDGVPVAGSYHAVDPNPQGIGAVLLSPLLGFFDAVDVELFILMVGGFLGIVMETGAINNGVAAVVRRMRGREKWMIPILMILFGLGGTTFGMWEETMAFYPILLPVFLAAGYDALVSVSVILLGAGAGVLCSTVNPFATGIASGFAGISLGEGLVLRFVMLLVYEAVAIWFVMGYAARIKANPDASIMAHNRWPEHEIPNMDEAEPLTGKQKIVLILFAAVFLVMIYSVIPFADVGIDFLPTLGWWFPELGALFLAGGLLVGFVYGLREAKVAECFVRGAAELLNVAFIIGLSRAITTIMSNGLITDTVLYWGEKLLSGAGSVGFILLTYLLYLPLSILIPSSSGLATLSIPIMAPLGQFAGVGGDLIITAFQSASGLVNLVTPTSAVVMGALVFGRIPYDRWIRYVWKLLAIFLVLTVGFLILGVLLA